MSMLKAEHAGACSSRYAFGSFLSEGRVKRKECSFVLGDANLGWLLTIATEGRLLRRGALRAEREKKKERKGGQKTDNNFVSGK